MLVGEGQGEAVAAGFGEHVVDGVGQVQEVVAFVDDEGGVGAVGWGWRARPVAACQSAATTSEPISRVVSSPRLPLGMRTSRCRLSRTVARSRSAGAGEDGAGEGAQQERAQPVHQGCEAWALAGSDSLRTSARTRADGVGDRGGGAGAEGGVGEQFGMSARVATPGVAGG